MIISGNQPYFLPYIGYWQLISAADIFLIGDDYTFIKEGWISRNRILDKQSIRAISLNICGVSSNILISHLSLTEDARFRTKILHQIETYYHSAPFFYDGFSLIEQIVLFPDLNLVSFLEHSIKIICSFLKINTIIRKTSEFNTYGVYEKQYRIFEYCKRLNADTYINAIGGKDIYSYNEFSQNGISLYFLQSNPIPYRQFGGSFIPNLSILDAIMFCSKEQLQEMLESYSLV